MTIKVKMLATVFIGMAVAMFIWGAIQINALDKSLERQRLQRLAELAETIGVNYQHFPKEQHLSPVDRMLENLVQIDDRLAAVSIFGVYAGRVELVAGAGRIYYNWKNANIVKTANRKKPHYSRLETKKGAATGVLYPMQKDNSTIVISIISLNSYQEEIVAAAELFLLVSSLAFIVVVMGALLLVYHLSVAKPLGVIIKTIDAAHSDVDLRQIPLQRSDEWGVLARHFNEMVKTFREVMQQNRELTGELQKKVSEATHKILVLQSQINELQRFSMLGHFVANLSHDMGTPLHSIAGITELLLEKPELSGEQRHKLNLILKQSRNLIAIIRDVRHATRPPSPRFTAVEARDLLEETVLSFEPMLQGTGITIDLTIAAGLMPIYLDRNRVQTALFNILQNAREALPKGGAIKVGAENTNEGDLVILIKDNGEGIPADIRGRVEEPFFSTKQEDGIRGLGLAIVRDVMKMHGGELKIISTVGSGVEVRLIFPVSRQEE